MNLSATSGMAVHREEKERRNSHFLRRKAGDLTYATNQTGEQIWGMLYACHYVRRRVWVYPFCMFVTSAQGYSFRIIDGGLFGTPDGTLKHNLDTAGFK